MEEGTQVAAGKTTWNQVSGTNRSGCSSPGAIYLEKAVKK